ncbi:MAG: TldD/PmbA family protein [Acidobacteria bacterium]|nr:TldD/PmbA family protein [Acidobacteriota bacterium]
MAFDTTSYEQLSADVVRMALDRGATGAECTVAEGEEFSASVRMREIEQLKQAGSRAAGLRVLVGGCTGSAYTSDLSLDGLRRMVASAVDNARITTEDPHAGLPDPADLGRHELNLGIYNDDVAALDPELKIRWAKEAEAAALDADARITNSEGAGFDSNLGARYFSNSLGFTGSYRTSSCSMSAVPVARQGETMERDYWYTVARSASRLEPAAEVGRRAAERVLRRLGARKVPTQKAPIVFEPRTARSLLGHIFEAVDGDSVYRQASFLAASLGERVAAEGVTLIDDGTLPGLFGTSPFDDEGVPTRRTLVIENGVLKSFLHNSYTARKLGMRTTGNASRGLSGNASVDHGNLFLEPGGKTPGDIIQSIRAGLLVTELLGQGVNTVTGDYSRGAAGVWIENGEIAYPVSEITIAGNLKQMLRDIEAIGNDLEFRGSVASPTLLIREMTISGN